MFWVKWKKGPRPNFVLKINKSMHLSVSGGTRTGGDLTISASDMKQSMVGNGDQVLSARLRSYLLSIVASQGTNFF